MQYRNHTEEVTARIAEADAERDEIRRRREAQTEELQQRRIAYDELQRRQTQGITAIEIGFLFAVAFAIVFLMIMTGEPPR